MWWRRRSRVALLVGAAEDGLVGSECAFRRSSLAVPFQRGAVVVAVVDVVPPGISLVVEVCFVSVAGGAWRGATCTSSQLVSEH